MSSAREVLKQALKDVSGQIVTDWDVDAILRAIDGAGKKIVDVEPTAAMIDAGIVERADGGTSPAEIWRAMVAAAEGGE